ncbi:MAG TPA: response regulator transcription factor [Acidimicrobiales bacterium]|nr:response regulator transcription factor [Acidimicrobiales bacterium]
MTDPVRVVIADDHAFLRDGLSRCLAGHGFDVVGEAGDGRSAVARVEELRPDLALIDVSMPVMDGISALRTIHARHPDLPVVVLTMHDDEALASEARAAGACGYLNKECSTDELVEALHEAIAGEVASGASRSSAGRSWKGELSVSGRELEVLRLLARGAGTAEIAKAMYISQKTVKNHLASIYQKLDARDRTQAVLRAIKIGLVSID